MQDLTDEHIAYVVPIPLFFVNFLVNGYRCTLGRRAFDRRFDNFVKDAFTKESERSGCFEVVDDGSEDYTANLTIVENETTGPYSNFFYRYFAGYVCGFCYREKAGPAKQILH